MEDLVNKIKEVARGKKFILKPVPGGEESHESDVIYVPDFEVLLKDINRALDTLRTVATSDDVINDPKFGDIYRQFRVLRNNLRTHMRNKYPSEYQKIQGMFEEQEIDETGFAVGAGAQYATPLAFKKVGPQELPEANPGASLGPGPKAGKTGVTNNYYYKLGWKPVAKPHSTKGAEIKYLWGK
jgi:hypothetical protein